MALSFSLAVRLGLLWMWPAGLVAPCGIWGLGSLTRDWTYVPCTGRWILKHWTTREAPKHIVKIRFLDSVFSMWWVSCQPFLFQASLSFSGSSSEVVFPPCRWGYSKDRGDPDTSGESSSQLPELTPMYLQTNIWKMDLVEKQFNDKNIKEPSF